MPHAPKYLSGTLIFLGLLSHVRADDWPQWMGPRRDGTWNETGILSRLPDAGPKLLWRAPVAGGYSGPAVAAGRVYLADFDGTGDKSPSPDKRNELVGHERLLCLDAKSGQVLWQHKYPCKYNISYPAGPRCTPTVDGDRVYLLGAEGRLSCLSDGGKLLWEKELKDEYRVPAPMWGFTSHPLIDGDKVICLVGGDGSTLVAFDKRTGKEIWKSLSAKEPGYSPPDIFTAGGKRQLVVWTSEAVHSVDPESGKPFWSISLEPKYGMSIMSPRKFGNYLYAGGIGWVSGLIELSSDQPNAKLVWNGKKDNSVYPVNSTPIVDGAILYGIDQPGQLTAVELPGGKRLWQTSTPTTGEKPASSGTAFLVKNGKRYFLFNEKGELIIARLSAEKYEEISRKKIIEPTGDAFGRLVVWSHPAFADKCIFARNDKEIVCYSLAE